ncbi:MAG: T9SS type A sorting domain-containing protein, partial [Candidatus Eisenbacteria bacterium]|nr:T9SS type A sorting domain-containing protein [Candidatus Eisenbacteria bacterium]
RGSGGPDAYGYTWSDSDEPGGPQFSWNDISSSGTLINLADDSYQEIALPFEFPFYGASHFFVRIASNGILVFGTGGNESSNASIPDTASPDGFVAPFWDDLDPGAGGQVHLDWVEESNEFIVQYTGVPRAGAPGSSMTFQVILGDDGSIRYQYLEMTGDLESATIGIESHSGAVGLPIACSTSYVHDDLAVEILPACQWLIADPWSGQSEAGESWPVSVCVDAAGLDLGESTCNLLVRSNDPDSVTVIVPVLAQLVDTGVEDDTPRRYELLGNFPNPFNPVTEIRYALPAPTEVSLEVYDLSGRVVRTLLAGETQDSGRYAVLWDGRSDRGAPVASGVYFYRLTADGRALSRKMILLK